MPLPLTNISLSAIRQEILGVETDAVTSLHDLYALSVAAAGTGLSAGSYHNVALGPGQTATFKSAIAVPWGTGTQAMSGWANYGQTVNFCFDLNVENNTASISSYTVQGTMWVYSGLGGTAVWSRSLVLPAGASFHGVGFTATSNANEVNNEGYYFVMSFTGSTLGGNCFLNQVSCEDIDGVGAPGSTARGWNTSYSGINIKTTPITGGVKAPMLALTVKGGSPTPIPWNKRTGFTMTFTNT